MALDLQGRLRSGLLRESGWLPRDNLRTVKCEVGIDLDYQATH